MPKFNVDDGQAIKERVINVLTIADATVWQDIYELLEEWQLLGIFLLILEMAEQDND